MTSIRGTALAPLDAGFLLKARSPEYQAERYCDAVIYLGAAAALRNRVTD